MKLYLYLSFRHLDVLRNNRLHFIGAAERNDPFENNRPAMSKTPDHVPVSEEDFKAELRRQYTALPEHMQALVDEEYFYNQLRQKRPAIEKQMRDRKRPGGGKKQLPDPTKLAPLALCRLFRSPVNPIIWERYGDQYSGFVIELDTRHPYFSGNRYKAQPQVLKPVSYSSDRPSVKARTQPFPALFYRPQPFEAEQEYRLVRARSTCDKETTLNGKTFFFYNFPPSVISRVIIGCNASDEDRKALMQLLSADLRYKKTPVDSLWLDLDLFILHCKPLKKTSVARQKVQQSDEADQTESSNPSEEQNSNPGPVIKASEHPSLRQPPSSPARPVAAPPRKPEVIKVAPKIRKAETDVIRPTGKGKTVSASSTRPKRQEKRSDKPVTPIQKSTQKPEVKKPVVAREKPRPKATEQQPDKPQVSPEVQNTELTQRSDTSTSVHPTKKPIRASRKVPESPYTARPGTSSDARKKPGQENTPDNARAPRPGKDKPLRTDNPLHSERALKSPAKTASGSSGKNAPAPGKQASEKRTPQNPEMAVIRPRKKSPE